MRVISGIYKGRKLIGYDLDGTRPTMDRVKESLFAIINKYLPNSCFLDLFSGSGSIGIEALSNGAATCYFIDNSKKAINILKHNLCNISNSTIINKDYKEALSLLKKENIKFDIIYIDPPYHINILNEALMLIEKYNLLNNNGIIICEYEEEIPCCTYPLLCYKKYGKTKIKIFKKDSN